MNNLWHSLSQLLNYVPLTDFKMFLMFLDHGFKVSGPFKGKVKL